MQQDFLTVPEITILVKNQGQILLKTIFNKFFPHRERLTTSI